MGDKAAAPPDAAARDAELEALHERVEALERERAARLDAERALRESEARYRELVAQCPDAIVVHRDGVILFVNDAAVRMAGPGIRPADLVGRSVLDFVHPEEREPAARQIQAAAAGAPPAGTVGVRVCAPDGRWLHVESVGRSRVFEGRPAVQVVVRDVTSRVEAERELSEMRSHLERRVEERTADLTEVLRRLAESEARHRALLAASPDTLLRVDREGRLLDVRPTAGLVQRLDPSIDWRAVIGRSVADYLPPDVASRATALIRHVIATGRTSAHDYHFPTSQGGVDFEARMVRAGPAEVVVTVRDVTEQRRAEAGLRESEARQRALLAASPDSLLRIARDGVLLDAHLSTAFPHVIGLGGFIGRPLAEALPPETARGVMAIVERVCRSGEGETAEHRFQADGVERVLEARVVASGPDEALAVVRDVTESRRAERALADSEERFRKTFEEGPLGMALIGEDLRFVQVNSTLCELLGYDAGTLCKRTFLGVTHPDDRARDVELLRELERGALTSFTMEKRYLHRSGEPIPVRVTGALIHAERPGLRYGLAMVEDRREEHRAQAALRSYEEKLRRTERLASVGTLAGGVAHEINNPIGSILLAAQYALQARPAGPVPEDVRESLEDIVAHARRCGRIVKSVLQFARQERSDRRLLDLCRSLAELRELAGPIAGTTGVAIQVLPPTEPLPVLADPTAIEQVLLNVVRNAAEASARGARVQVRGSRAADVARIDVRDWGRGMSEEERTYLFDPFYTTRREQGGTGLGLSISHGIVSDHGGAIHVESEPGQGTTVTIELPLQPGRGGED